MRILNFLLSLMICLSCQVVAQDMTFELPENLPFTLSAGYTSVDISMNNNSKSVTLDNSNKSFLLGLFYEHEQEGSPIVSYIGGVIFLSDIARVSYEEDSLVSTVDIENAKYFIAKSIHIGLKRLIKEVFYIRIGFNYTYLSYDVNFEDNSLKASNGFGYHYALGWNILPFLNLEFSNIELSKNILGSVDDIASASGGVACSAISFRYHY